MLPLLSRHSARRYGRMRWAWACTARFPRAARARALATASSDPESDPDIDLINLRRTGATSSSLAVYLNGKRVLRHVYSPALVQKALLQVSLASVPALDQLPVSDDLLAFVCGHCAELAHLNDFVSVSYSSKLSSVAQLTAVELANVLRIYRDLSRSGKLAHYAGLDAAGPKGWLDELLAFLSVRSKVSESVPVVIGTVMELLESKGSAYAEMYGHGLGLFFPELRALNSEYPFERLDSVAPVASKISALVDEFVVFLRDHEHSLLFDADFFCVVIFVLRYRTLQALLLTLEDCGILARDIHQLLADKQAPRFQDQLNALTTSRLDELIFSTHRNFFNAIYTNMGLARFDEILALLHQEAAKDTYTAQEKALIESFLDAFSPLLCEGVLKIETLRDVKYTCLPARYEGKAIIPFKMSDNIFDNYETSLALLLDIPDRAHLLKAAAPRLGKRFGASTVLEIVDAVAGANADSGYLIEADVEKLTAALREFNAFKIRPTFEYLDTLLETPGLLALAQAQDTRFSHVAQMNPEVHNLSVPTKAHEFSTVRINNLGLADFSNELSAFKSVDLAGFNYSSLGYSTLLRYMQQRLTEVLSEHITRPYSAINSENVARFAMLNDLLIANFDINGSNTDFLDEYSSATLNTEKTSESPSKAAPVLESAAYEQIPEHLKIHMFTPELVIIKEDELKLDFKNHTADDILLLLRTRVNEVRNDLPLSNPTSRITQSNVVRFMKVLSRLKELFAVNGGNTEVLDAVIRSLSVLGDFEKKLAAKREAALKAHTDEVKAGADKQNVASAPGTQKEKTASSIPGTYLQIPDNLQLHDYVSELELFRHDDLRSSYKNFPPEKILGLMGKRIKEIYKDLPSTNLALRMGKNNLVRFIQLHAKLEKLFVWNGGNTGILDTMIHSQSVFNEFESKTKSRKSVEESTERAYRQIPEDVFLEEYAAELTKLRAELGELFAASSAPKILATLRTISDNDVSVDQKLIYEKLYRNLQCVFKYNNSETFVLDNVLLNAAAFEKFESTLQAKDADNKFEMSEFLDGSPNGTKYRDSEHIFALLGKETSAAEAEKIPENQVLIQEALAEAMSSEERKILEENPAEHAAINSLTAKKIRDSYKVKSGEKSEPLDKETLKKFLKQAKKEKDTKDEFKWREREAYEWSANKCKGYRSLESRNFFNPMFSGAKATGFPMFPGSDNMFEYLVLTPSGQTFRSADNPLGQDHVAEDMFAVLEKFPEEELKKYSKNIKKLQKKNWRVISSGGTEKMLVLRRIKFDRKKDILKRIKTILAIAGAVFVTLLGFNIWIGDTPEEGNVFKKEPEPSQVPKLVSPPAVTVLEEAIVENSQEPTKLSHIPTQKPSLWKRLLWK